MAYNLGHNAKFAVGTTKVGQVTSMSPSISMETTEAREYGDAWMKPVVTGRSFSASVEGFLDLTDAKQLELHNAALDSTSTDAANVCAVDDLRFYVDADNYFTVDTAADADAHFVITSYSPTPDLSGLVSFTMDIQAFGPITYTS